MATRTPRRIPTTLQQAQRAVRTAVRNGDGATVMRIFRDCRPTWEGRLRAIFTREIERLRTADPFTLEHLGTSMGIADSLAPFPRAPQNGSRALTLQAVTERQLSLELYAIAGALDAGEMSTGNALDRLRALADSRIPVEMNGTRTGRTQSQRPNVANPPRPEPNRWQSMIDEADDAPQDIVDDAFGHVPGWVDSRVHAVEPVEAEPDLCDKCGGDNAATCTCDVPEPDPDGDRWSMLELD